MKILASVFLFTIVLESARFAYGQDFNAEKISALN